jgi:glyoxylase-like metal-dependent hydrolase (beta-lactamase superfamily II)
MIVETATGGPFFQNAFVVACERTREGVLIDPGDAVAELLSFVEQQHLTIGHILLTHAHIDHLTGIPAARRALNVPIVLHRDDLFLYQEVDKQSAMFDVPIARLPPVDAFYEGGQVFRIGDYEIRAQHTPGHSPGGVCLSVTSAAGEAPWLFPGDTLFAGSIGRTDLPGGDPATLLASIHNVLLPFGDAARVYPGHGPETTIGRERRTNPFLTPSRR